MQSSTQQSFSIKKGQYIELVKDANYIPAGIYRVQDVYEDEIHFQLGRGIHFGFSTKYLDRVKPISKMKGISECTSSADFTRRYFDLVESKSSNYSLNGSEPTSFCSMTLEAMKAFRPEATYNVIH